jgi:DNA polymerase
MISRINQPIHETPIPPEHVGSHPQLLLIGMCPGREEAIQMRPFVGRAGKFVRNIMESFPIDYTLTYFVPIPYYSPPTHSVYKEWELSICAQVVKF